jgi:hypothetical protein
MNDSWLSDLRQEVLDALESTWFLRSLEEVERTDDTFSLRLHIHSQLFIQIFAGVRSGSLYMALIEMGRRVYGVDRDAHGWHLHPYENVSQHQPMPEGFDPKPVQRFIAQVEAILIENEFI